MERTIRIANTKTQQRYAIQTSATTLGELQDQMTAQGIDFEGMSFTEGLSKTQLFSRESLLPTNVMYKGQPTNDLVMLLTNTSKQISSGAIDRKEAYRLVKELGLQDAIQEGEGANFTRVKTDILEEYININRRRVEDFDKKLKAIKEIQNNITNVIETPVDTPAPKVAAHPDLVELLYLGVKYLAKKNMLFTDDVEVIADLTNELAGRMKADKPKISDDDIDDIIANI